MPESCTLDPEPPPVPLLDQAFREGQAEAETDLVVLDMQMPVMDGYETAQALRDRGFTGPILALTANVLAVDRQRCMDAGCDAFLGKPIRVKQLLTVCAGLLAQPEIPEGVET